MCISLLLCVYRAFVEAFYYFLSLFVCSLAWIGILSVCQSVLVCLTMCLKACVYLCSQ